MILITGATGQLGSAVVARLRQRVPAEDIAVLVRDRGKATGLADAGVSVRVGDDDDREALDRSLVGVDRVLLIAGNDPERRVQQHQNVIDAAVRAQVRLFGFASRSLRDVATSANGLMADYVATEERVRASGLTHLLFRNALYLDTVPLYVGGAQVFETGIRLPAGQGRVAYALRREMGEALANAMLDHVGGDRTYVVAAPEGYGFTDVATALTEVSGRPVRYTEVTEEAYLAGMVAAGVPAGAGQRVLGFIADIRDGQLDETSNDLGALLGRAPATLADGVRELFALPAAVG